MRMKLLVLSIFMASNVHALENGITLLKHEEWKNVPLPAELVAMKPTSSSASTSAVAYYASCVHGSNCYASGYVSYQIHNYSTATQTYYIDKYMCIENTNCVHTKDTYQLISGAYTSNGTNMSINEYMSTKGTYEDEAIITISGYESSSAKGTNQVVVN